MKKGIELLDIIGRVLLGVVFVLFIVSFFIPQGRYIILIALGGFFIFPFTQEFLFWFYKFYYRNIEVAEGFLDEEEGMFEKIKWRIIKVIPLKLLPALLHERYKKLIDQNYKDILRDKSIAELNTFLLIDKSGDFGEKKDEKKGDEK